MSSCPKEINLITSKVVLSQRKRLGSHFLSKSKFILTLIVISILSLSILQLFIANKLATEGEQIKDNEVLSQKIAEENISLKNDLQALGSLSRVSQLAVNQGFVKVERVEYLNPGVAVATLR